MVGCGGGVALGANSQSQMLLMEESWVQCFMGNFTISTRGTLSINHMTAIKKNTGCKTGGTKTKAKKTSILTINVSNRVMARGENL